MDDAHADGNLGVLGEPINTLERFRAYIESQHRGQQRRRGPPEATACQTGVLNRLEVAVPKLAVPHPAVFSLFAVLAADPVVIPVLVVDVVWVHGDVPIAKVVEYVAENLLREVQDAQPSIVVPSMVHGAYLVRWSGINRYYKV